MKEGLPINILIILFAKIISKAASLLGGGSSLPGKIALSLNKNILSYAARGYKVILVTGTNGKTTTCSMLQNMLLKSGMPVINNSSGANMLSGITSCFIDNFSFRKKPNTIAVIETDEAYMRYVTEQIVPDYILITNLFLDQTDRFSDISATWKLIGEAISKVPQSTLILNGDEGIFAEIPYPNPKIYFGFSNGNGENVDPALCHKCNSPYEFRFVTLEGLGDYTCPACGLSRPSLTYIVDTVSALSIDGSDVVINKTPLHIGVPGLYNVYNALAATSAARELSVPFESIAQSLKMQESKFGRHEIIPIENAKAHMVLIKNPAGCNECINTVILDEDEADLLFMLNDNYADGIDISWIWDAAFEKLASMHYSHVLIGGLRRHDMAQRLKAANLDENKFIICDDFSQITDAIRAHCSGTVYTFSTYTAMTGFRKHLRSLGYVKKVWE